MNFKTVEIKDRMTLYLSTAWLLHPSFQGNQVSTEAFPQLIKKGQVEGNSEQGIEHTEDLPCHCAGRQVTITWKKNKKSYMKRHYSQAAGHPGEFLGLEVQLR